MRRWRFGRWITADGGHVAADGATGRDCERGVQHADCRELAGLHGRGHGRGGYRVFRNGAANAVATASGTSFTDSGLTPATQYSYTVSAFDAATPANESARSGRGRRHDAGGRRRSSGLDARPDNTTCIAGERPSQAVTLATERAFPNLPAFSSPVLMLQAPGDATHWFVVEQGGKVRVFDNQAGVASVRPFVDITSRVRSGGEQGLLGMAFHPGYPTDPRVYLSYTNATNGLVSRISEFRTRDGGLTLDPASEVDPAHGRAAGHQSQRRQHRVRAGRLPVRRVRRRRQRRGPWGSIGNGQNLTTLLGKLLRIDVNGSTGGVPYRIPAGNPYAGNTLCNSGAGTQNCPEIYAYGLRNPWRWSFDRGSGELWLADVGQGAIEEVDRIVPGGNYGWRCFEGTQAYNSTCGPNSASSLPPVAQYTHAVRRVGHRRIRLPRRGHPRARGPIRVRRFRIRAHLAHRPRHAADADASPRDSTAACRSLRSGRAATASCTSWTTAGRCTGCGRARAAAARCPASCRPPVASRQVTPPGPRPA